MSKLLNQQGIVPLVAVGVAVLLAAGSTGTVLASQSSVTGDLLYPVKQATERFELLVANSPEAKAAVHLEIAKHRLAEVEKLQQKHADAKRIKQTTDDLEREQAEVQTHVDDAEEQGDAATTVKDELDRQHKNAETALEAAIAKAPEEAKDALEHALEQTKKAAEKREEAKSKALESKSKGKGHSSDDKQ